MARQVKVRVERLIKQYCTVTVEVDDDALDEQVRAEAYAAAGYDSPWEDDQSGDEEEGTHVILEEYDDVPLIDLTDGDEADSEACEHPNAVESDGDDPPTWHCPDCGENFMLGEEEVTDCAHPSVRPTPGWHPPMGTCPDCGETVFIKEAGE